MEKTVYCLLYSRRKRVRYVPIQGVSEANLIRESLIAACKTDRILEMMMKDKLIVLQTVDLDIENEWCDIEDTDAIVDKSEVKVLLIDMPPNVKPAPHTLPSTSASYNPDNLNAGETVEIDVNVLYTESGDPNDNPVISENAKNGGDGTNIIEHEDKSTDDILPCEIDVTLDLKSEAKSKKKGRTDTAGCSGTQMCVAKIENKAKSLNRVFIPNPAILPQLSFDLQTRLEEQGIENCQQYLMRFWGEYLWHETRGQPSKQDYNNLATSIVAAYPLLAGGVSGNGIVRGQLSVWIRNRRANSNRVKNKAKKRDHNGNEVQVSVPTTKAVMVKTDAMETDLKAALAELEKKFVPGKNSSHVKRLLQVTKSDRRTWIENQANRIIDIVDKYPPLSDYEMILFECITVVEKTTENVVFEQIDIMINELKKYYSTHGNTEDTETTSEIIIEKIEASILEQLCDELALKRVKKKISPLCTVKPVLGSTQHLVTHEGEAPRVVMYMTEEGKIGQAFIIADEQIRVNVPEPTVPKIIAGLLSSYYAWHRAFPPGYSSALEFIAYKISKIPIKSNSTVAKFLRKLDNFLSLSSSECNE